MAVQKPTLNITQCTENINKLLIILNAESKAEVGSFLYHLCFQKTKPVEEEGLGISKPSIPLGWIPSFRNEDVSQVRSNWLCPPSMNNEEIEQYYVSLYCKTFETIINSVKVRYNTSIVLAMEKYLTITNESELAECGTAISDVAAHLGINSCLLQTEITQFRRYENEVNTPHATSAEDVGISLASNTVLRTILKCLSDVVQHLLFLPATS